MAQREHRDASSDFRYLNPAVVPQLRLPPSSLRGVLFLSLALSRSWRPTEWANVLTSCYSLTNCITFFLSIFPVNVLVLSRLLLLFSTPPPIKHLSLLPLDDGVFSRPQGVRSPSVEEGTGRASSQGRD